jgi:hypothetical protein
MVKINNISALKTNRIVFLSIFLFFFTIPHTLEDFATGEPDKVGIPVALLALIVSIIFGLQALGLYWLGQNRRRALWIHLGLGVFWPFASGVAQLPTILSGVPFRSGFISVLYVLGIIIIGILLAFFSQQALRSK